MGRLLRLSRPVRDAPSNTISSQVTCGTHVPWTPAAYCKRRPIRDETAWPSPSGIRAGDSVPREAGLLRTYPYASGMAWPHFRKPATEIVENLDEYD